MPSLTGEANEELFNLLTIVPAVLPLEVSAAAASVGAAKGITRAVIRTTAANKECHFL